MQLEGARAAPHRRAGAACRGRFLQTSSDAAIVRQASSAELEISRGRDGSRDCEKEPTMLDGAALGISEWQTAHDALTRLARKRAGLDFAEGQWLRAALRCHCHARLG